MKRSNKLRAITGLTGFNPYHDGLNPDRTLPEIDIPEISAQTVKKTAEIKNGIVRKVSEGRDEGPKATLNAQANDSVFHHLIRKATRDKRGGTHPFINGGIGEHLENIGWRTNLVLDVDTVPDEPVKEVVVH